MFQLPKELQIQILSNLELRDLLVATSVCRQWMALALDGSLWSRLDLTSCYDKIPVDQLVRLTRAGGKFLKAANFRGCVQLTGHELNALARSCPNIQTLCLRDCHSLSARCLLDVMSRAKQLTALDLSGLACVDVETVHAIGQHLPLLQKLNLSWCRRLLPHSLPALAGCKDLQVLRLDGLALGTNLAGDKALASLGQLTRLVHLSLGSCTSLTDPLLLAFLQSTRARLTHLNVSRCTRLSNTSLQHIATFTPHLTHLELAGCILLTDNGFSQALPHLPHLAYLDLEDVHHITGSTAVCLGRYASQLVHLCLSNCTHIGDHALVHLVVRSSCQQLQHVELDGCNVTNYALDTIAMSLAATTLPGATRPPRRVLLSVLDCLRVTERGVRTALDKAGSVLTIKSFYTWRDQWTTGQEQEDAQDDRSPNLSVSSSPLRPTSLLSYRRRRVSTNHVHADQCVIL